MCFAMFQVLDWMVNKEDAAILMAKKSGRPRRGRKSTSSAQSSSELFTGASPSQLATPTSNAARSHSLPFGSVPTHEYANGITSPAGMFLLEFCWLLEDTASTNKVQCNGNRLLVIILSVGVCVF